jgi:heme-degrading monooxygenase HmoA
VKAHNAALLNSGTWTYVVGWPGVPLWYRRHLEAGTMIGGHAADRREGATLLLRIWTTRYDPARRAELEAFAQTVSLPMFHRQQGLRGVLFAANGDLFAAVTFWESQEAIRKLEQESADYAEVVRRIMLTGFLLGEQRVEVLEVVGGDLPLTATAT